MRIVTAKELKNKTGEVLRQVRSGETVVVTVRGVRVARFLPEKRAAVDRTVQSGKWSRHGLVRGIAGKYRGMGTVDEFLREKAREIVLEG